MSRSFAGSTRTIRSSSRPLIPSPTALAYAWPLLRGPPEWRSREQPLRRRDILGLGRELVERLLARSEVQAPDDRGGHPLQGGGRLGARSARRQPTTRSMVGGVR